MQLQDSPCFFDRRSKNKKEEERSEKKKEAKKKKQKEKISKKRKEAKETLSLLPNPLYKINLIFPFKKD